jgi:hypothetical protein
MPLVVARSAEAEQPRQASGSFGINIVRFKFS